MDIANITIAPTQQEVLCQATPYLPANHPGTVMHLEADSPEAHRDLHFRSERRYLQDPTAMMQHDSLHWPGEMWKPCS